MAIGQKEWVAKYKNHKIRDINTWFAGAKLYVDGECRDTSSSLIATSKDAPLLSAKLNDDEIVEIYLIAVWTTKAKICINGEQVGGDVL